MHGMTALAANMAILSFLALSAYVVLLAGEISFGQQAFFAIGAYAAGMSTAMAGWPLALGLASGAAAGATAAAFVALVAVRLHGVAFAVASLAFAEATRIAFELFHWQIDIEGERIGPNGVDGFRGIRAVFDAQMSDTSYLLLVVCLLTVTLILFGAIERTRLGVALRQIGEDAILAAHGGVPVVALRIAAITAGGALAGLGGGLYAHLLTYVEPRNFDIMLGVHALAYGLIGGLGTVFGPILGVIIDIVLIEASRLFGGWRMVVFGGLVAVILIWKPRGLLDEPAVNAINRRVALRRAKARS
jgi:branched-chain amino acid transport system permease protein